jgi:hypothetical protein
LTACTEPSTHLQNGVCVANTCTPNQPTTCLAANGTGTATCNAQGTGYTAACVPTTCNSGYALNGQQCLPVICTYVPPYGLVSCTDSTKTGNGIATCDPTGTVQGACTIFTCPDPAYPYLNATSSACTALPAGANGTSGNGLNCNSVGIAAGNCSAN